ncbi:ABC transporter ATP-binding protein [Amycolatopsis acidicola]|uniref:ABC transporter ATP-binding protein n=1 Tax=Amycolatopsis acidicola TaxID=2596893 RepID=A0A5N0VLA9_9PSEU|nr:ABC transporter ATP-binding protein [Amycolatopsis acidicola]KAA9166508.1 ABC transporter ATP-binding protein [Amycolatopsis acidicola]
MSARPALSPVPGTVPAEAVIDVSDLWMRYGATEVLTGVGFSVRRGEVVALLGPNGVGKSTTIEILEGFRVRSAGRVAVLGEDPERGGRRWRSEIGVVLQSWADHGRWRVRELIAHLGAYYTPYARQPWDPDELLELVGLTGQARQKLRRLTQGQRRRLDVAIGLAGRPRLLFLDEPTVGFDPRARHDFHGMIRRLAETEQTTILLATHDLAEAERLAHRIVLLAGGRIIADGSAAELARRAGAAGEVRWTRDGRQFRESTPRPARLVHRLYAEYGADITELEVRRATLEQTYLTLVADWESGGVATADAFVARPR